MCNMHHLLGRMDAPGCLLHLSPCVPWPLSACPHKSFRRLESKAWSCLPLQHAKYLNVYSNSSCFGHLKNWGLCGAPVDIFLLRAPTISWSCGPLVELGPKPSVFGFHYLTSLASEPKTSLNGPYEIQPIPKLDLTDLELFSSFKLPIVWLTFARSWNLCCHGYNAWKLQPTCHNCTSLNSHLL